METGAVPATTLNPVPVTVAWEIVTAAVPVLLRVKVGELPDPAATFPKFRVVGLAPSVPVEVEAELGFAGAVPAPVKPVQPEIVRNIELAKIRANMPSGARRLGVCRSRKPCFI